MFHPAGQRAHGERSVQVTQNILPQAAILKRRIPSADLTNTGFLPKKTGRRSLRTIFFQQPFGPSGRHQTLGAAFLARTADPDYQSLKICVAYVTAGGTARIYRALRDFVGRGGNAEVYIGIANGVSSGKAVGHLLMSGASVWGLDTSKTVLFHPKVYVLEGPNSAWISVGSSNLTCEGLFRNFEANILIELDLASDADRAYLAELTVWFDDFRRYGDACLRITHAEVGRLVDSGLLVDEVASAHAQRYPVPGGRRLPGRAGPVRIPVPAAPPPDPELQGSRTRLRPARPSRGAAAPPAHRAIAAGSSQYFAMTLSAFDCSHRTGVPGTPEVSLPEDTAHFFPRVSVQGRQYPDAYFNVILNRPNGRAEIIRIRIWQRPPGSGSGHADWRLNVHHATVDLTDPAGGDILLFERLPRGSEPPYEAWIVGRGQPQHAPLLARCTQQVQASGQAGIKRYGLF